MLNKVILIGNVGNMPEIRSTQDGKKIANFSIATSESWTDKTTSEKHKKTEWHKVVVLNQALVKIVADLVSKGTKLYIEGSVHTRKWQNKSGQDQYTTEIVLSAFNSQVRILSNNNQLNESPGDDVDSFDDEINF